MLNQVIFLTYLIENTTFVFAPPYIKERFSRKTSLYGSRSQRTYITTLNISN